MQYSKVFSTLIVGVLAGIQACNAQSYSLYAETSENLNTVYKTVSWVNSADGGAYIGNVKLQQAAELLTVVPTLPYGGLRFLTYHSDRYQEWYIKKDESQPVGFAMWQSIPPNVVTTGFIISDGYLHYQEGDCWAVCPSATYAQSYKLYYVGDNTAPADCIAVKLRAQKYGMCDVPK